MSENEKLFEKYFNSINETLEQTVKFHSFSKYCQKSDFLNNKSLEEYSGFIDNLYICSNHARIACLNKLIDKKGFSFNDLIEFVSTHPQLFNKKKEDTIAELNEVQNKLKKFDSTITYLIEHRNEFHAHLGRKSVGSEDLYNVFSEFKVSEEDIDGLIKTLCSCTIKINFIFHETYENAFIYNLVNNEELVYKFCEIQKVFNLMYYASNHIKLLPGHSDLYFNNLTKHYN
jgi:hypothetical protein